jgi:hypothetical protein
MGMEDGQMPLAPQDAEDEAALATSDIDSSAAPRDFRELRTLILERRDRLPKRLVQVADFAIHHPQEIAFGRVAELARKAQVQPSTMIRFAQALGYSGFSDLQLVFQSYARDRWPDYNTRLEVLHDGAHGGDALSLLDGLVEASAPSMWWACAAPSRSRSTSPMPFRSSAPAATSSTSSAASAPAKRTSSGLRMRCSP